MFKCNASSAWMQNRAHCAKSCLTSMIPPYKFLGPFLRFLIGDLVSMSHDQNFNPNLHYFQWKSEKASKLDNAKSVQAISIGETGFTGCAGLTDLSG